MQTIDLAAFAATKAADRRAIAVLAYDNATADPDYANWRAVADMLRMALPAVRKKADADTPDAPSPFAPWADYPIPQKYRCDRPSPVIEVRFSDGRTFRAPAVSLKGKPLNVARGMRNAICFYRSRIVAEFCGKDYEGRDVVNVPEIESCVCVLTGETFDPAECNAMTAQDRAGWFDLPTVQAEAAERGLPDDAGFDGLSVSGLIVARYKQATAAALLTLAAPSSDKAEELHRMANYARDYAARPNPEPVAPSADVTPVAPSAQVVPLRRPLPGMARLLSSTAMRLAA